MTKFMIVERQACFIDFFHEVEAESEQEALALNYDGDYVYVGHTIQDSIPFLDSSVALTDGAPPRYIANRNPERKEDHYEQD